MAPLVVLVVASIAFWLAGRLGVTTFQHAGTVLRTALALMFLLTAVGHQNSIKSENERLHGLDPAL